MNEVQQHQKTDVTGVHLTNAALEHILSHLQHNTAYSGIRLSTKKTGCSGLSYVVDYVSDANPEDIIQPISDSYWVYIDRKSYPYLKGLHIDYVKQGLNKKLVFINPNQTGQCGCGESFTVE